MIGKLRIQFQALVSACFGKGRVGKRPVFMTEIMHPLSISLDLSVAEYEKNMITHLCVAD